MAKKKKAVSDFRYDSGDAVVPWAAVGEPLRNREIMQILSYLVEPARRKTVAYNKQLRRIGKELDKLIELGEFAGKLTLGNHVLALQNRCKAFLQAKHATFLANCTAGFEIAHKFAGLKPGVEVKVRLTGQTRRGKWRVQLLDGSGEGIVHSKESPAGAEVGAELAVVFEAGGNPSDLNFRWKQG